jgi:acetyl esterase/lipase
VAGVTIAPATSSYGPHRSQTADLYLPAAGSGAAAPFPVVVLVHGGFWRKPYDRALMEPLARDLAARGIAAWNIDYRRVGDLPAGTPDAWRAAFDDVSSAMDDLAAWAPDEGVDIERVAVVGHSAGGHLALWLASEFELAAVVSLAGVANLYDAAHDKLSPGVAERGLGVVGVPAVVELLGGTPEEVPDRYAYASPSALLPLRTPILAVHGTADDTVPFTQSRDFVDAAREAGDPAGLVAEPGAGHFEVVDPAHGSWTDVVVPFLRGEFGRE